MPLDLHFACGPYLAPVARLCLYELDHAHLHAASPGAQQRTQGGGSLTFAIARVHDYKPASHSSCSFRSWIAVISTCPLCFQFVTNKNPFVASNLDKGKQMPATTRKDSRS